VTKPSLSNKKLRREKKRHLDKRLQMLFRRVKLIEDELLALESMDDFYRVCIFGSARIKADTPQYDQVRELAEKLASRGIDILTGGGPGLMEAANLGAKRGALAGETKGKSFGISIELPFEPKPNSHLDIKRHHHKFSSRLDDFMRLSHAIVVTPGGVGTLLELFFCWQLVQVNHAITRPIILLERSYWDGIYTWLQDVPLARGLISENDFIPISIADSVDEACERIFAHYQETRGTESC
jgi:uncharacterized protein (TIGR00730 family)